MSLNMHCLWTGKKYKWKSLMALLIIGLCMSISGCSYFNKNDNADSNANITNIKGNIDGIEVNFINVGKGDCIIVNTGNSSVMIDTGYEETAPEVLKYLNDNGIKQIDCMIITHYDKDHVGGASAIMKSVDVKAIYMPDYEGEGSKYKKFIKYLNKNGKMNIVTYVNEDISIEIDGVKFDIYAPQKEYYLDENNYSLVTKVTNGQDSFLMAGDAEEDRIDELLGNEMLECNVFKAPHHGELSKNNIQFVEEANPQYVIFTSASEEDVSTSIIYALEQIGAKYYFTCYGNIKCISDGSGNIEIIQ